MRITIDGKFEDATAAILKDIYDSEEEDDEDDEAIEVKANEEEDDEDDEAVEVNANEEEYISSEMNYVTWLSCIISYMFKLFTDNCTTETHLQPIQQIR